MLKTSHFFRTSALCCQSAGVAAALLLFNAPAFAHDDAAVGNGAALTLASEAALPRPGGGMSPALCEVGTSVNPVSKVKFLLALRRNTAAA